MTDIASLNIRVNSLEAKAAKQDLDRLTGAGQKTERQMSTMSKAAVRLGAALTAAFSTYQLSQFIKTATLAYARFETLGVVMKQVGQNAGYSASEMTGFENQLRKSGIAMTESRLTLTKMVQAQIDLADSAKLARLAQDAAVIGNLNSSEAFSKLIHGIQTAQTEILRTIGLNVRFEDGYKKLAAQLGKSANELSEVEKTQARVNLVMEAGTRISGVYEAAMETAGKKFGSMTRHVDDLMVVIGKTFDQTFVKGIDAVTEILKATRAWVEENDKLLQMGFETGLARVVDVLKILVVLIGARLVASLTKSTTSLIYHHQQWIAYQATLARYAGISRSAAAGQIALNSAVNLGKGALALVGGPAGAATLAAMAIFHFREELGLVPPDADKAVSAIDKLTGSLQNLTAAQVKNKRFQIIDEIDKQIKNLQKLEKEYERVSRMAGTDGMMYGKAGEGTKRLAALAVKIEKVKDGIDRLKSSLDLLEIMPTAKNDAENLRRVANALDSVTNNIVNTTETIGEVEQAFKDMEEAAGIDKWLSSFFSDLDDMKAEMGNTAQAAWELEAALKAIKYSEEATQAYWIDYIENMNAVIAKEKEDWENLQKEKTKSQEEALGKQQKAQEQAVKEYEKMLENIQDFAADTFYDIFQGNIDGWEDMADRMKDIFLKMLAEIAAKAMMQQIVVPVMANITGGPGMPALGGGGGFSNILGSFMGGGNPLIGSTLGGGNAITSLVGNVGSLLGFGGSAMTAATTGALAGNTAAALGIGNIGSIAAGGGAGMGMFGSSLAGSGALAGIGTALSTILPIAAIALPFLGDLFGGSEPVPALGLGQGQNASAGQDAIVNSSRYNMFTWMQDQGEGAGLLNNEIMTYFEDRFDEMDELFEFSFRDVINNTEWNVGWMYLEKYKDNVQGLIQDMSGRIFDDVQEALFDAAFGPGAFGSTTETYMREVELDTGRWETTSRGSRQDPLRTWIPDTAMEEATRTVSGAAAAGLNTEFFEAIGGEDGDAFSGFANFVSVINQFDDGLQRFTEQVMEFGESAMGAYENMLGIAQVMAEVDNLTISLTSTQTTAQLEGLTATWDALIATLNEAHATTEEITAAEQARATALGASISGLTAGTLQQALMSGDSQGSLTSTFRQSMGTMLSGVLAEDISAQFFQPFQEALGEAYMEHGIGYLADNFGTILEESMDTDALIAALNDADSELSEFLGSAEDAISEIAENLSVSASRMRRAQMQIARALLPEEEAGDFFLNQMQERYSGFDVSSGNVLSALEGLLGLDPTSNNMGEFLAQLSETLGEDISFDEYTQDIMALADHFDLLQDSTNGLADSEDALRQARENALNDIQRLIDNLMGGSLAPVQSLEFFTGRYQQLAGDAFGAMGTEDFDDAVSALTGFIPNLLDFASAYGGDYRSLWDSVMADLENLGGDIPSFAVGGFHSGGLAMVHSAELINTGPANITNREDTMALISEAVSNTRGDINLHCTIEMDGRVVKELVIEGLNTDPEMQNGVRRITA